MNLVELAETSLIPDRVIRVGIRRLLTRRRRSQGVCDPSTASSRFAEQLRTGPLAIETQTANQQHYEVPAEFFCRVLGPRLKYSSCLFETSKSSLADAEETMLELTCQRAGIQDGMRILELGCGWGSLTLWIAEHFPDCQITAVSNSSSQRRFIESRAQSQQLSNIQVITADMRDFSRTDNFDRVVSVEMFEHMRNYELLLRRVSTWLKPNGRAFVHIFCHRDTPYLFETEGATNWMGRHFFTGGMMPSEHLFDQFDEDLSVERQWRVSGLHYWRTCEAWLRRLDQDRAEILAIFRKELPVAEAKKVVQRWRMFFMACAELFRYSDGNEWFVAHYLFQKQEGTRGREATPVRSQGELETSA